MGNGSSAEKQGAARWAKCPNCANWVHVAAPLLERGDVDLFCPSCEHRFPPAEAAETV